MGGGRGMGMNSGIDAAGPNSNYQMSPVDSGEDEVTALKEQAKALQQQMNAIQDRIRRIEK